MQKLKSKIWMKFSLLLGCLFLFTSMQAQLNVKGKIVDGDNEPLIGASVSEKGTSNAVMTDIDGNYQISATNNATLVFSYVGYTTKEVAVNGRTTINMTLSAKEDILDEVIVVGYGTQKKTSLTAAVSQIDGKDILTTPSTNISSVLGGRLPGVSSRQESGQPGMDNAALYIRGSRIGATYIVDGIPRAINDINPNDVATVSVLKDASSAAVYGLGSAGGVIIITTKSGKKGESKITYDGSFGISKNANFPKFLNGPEYAYYYNRGLELDGGQAIFTQQHIDMMTNGDDSDGWANTNWINKVFGTGHNQQHNITLTGGAEKFNYYASLGYMDQQGNIDRFSYKRYNLRAKVDAEVAKNLKMTVNVSGIRGDRNSPAFAAGGNSGSGGDDHWMSIARQTIASMPFIPVQYNGLYTASGNTLAQPNSPIAAINESGKYKNNTMKIQTNVSLEWNVPWLKGLSAKVNGTYDYSNETAKNLSTPYKVMLVKLPSSTLPNLQYSEQNDPRAARSITLTEAHGRNNFLVGQASLNYETKINKDHSIKAMILGEVQENKWNNLQASAKNLDFPELPELSNGVPADQPIAGASTHWRKAGFVYRINYDYASKYILELSGRYDGSYKFSGNRSNKRWAFFPSASVGWRISEEDFMKDFEFIDNLKLRAAAGRLGTDGVPAYSYLSQYRYGNPILLNGNQVNTMYQNVVANIDLTWDYTRSTNIGFDATLWGGLLGVEFDVFYNYRYKMLAANNANISPSMGGYYKTYANNDRQDSKGVEIILTHQNKYEVDGKTLNYGAKFNMGWAKTRWLRYGESTDLPDYQRTPGTAAGSLKIYKADGLYKSEEDIDNSPWRGNTRPRVGDVKYVDVNGDGVIDEQDRGYFGKSNIPEITGGLTLYADWNGFDINVFFQGATKCEASLTGVYFNGHDDTSVFTRLFKDAGNSPRYLAKGAWSPENPNGKYPRLSVNTPTNANGYASTFWMRNGEYLRLKSMQIGYTLPKQLIRKAGIDNVRFYVEGSNLLTWSHLPKGIDPEMPAVTNGYYPQQRVFMTGLSVTF
ncbi:TonB-dependent receptor [Dysgonomonas sp. 25]|uniref:SusC/RagA family TonB-linked outer membrane protein n=1 Tax=Dysgonomonas sp. 25 TaxID=2302933 RepID=UPI0013D728E0|nr:TonB-dependent receptor [Dysgonomonas sp. 25]NDV69697.1 TonB-dependent receptor [Dysgonomonas sp. 25]